VHYKLGLVLDMTSGRLKDAIAHVEQAVATTQARLDELRAALAADAPAPSEPAKDTKGKGKAVASGSVAALSKSQIEAEIKEMEGLSDDLKLKVSRGWFLVSARANSFQLEELSQPEQEEAQAVDGQLSAPALAALALDKDLNGGAKSSAAGTVPGQTGPVNDLTGMVKKKKKADATPATTGTKRKADEDEEAPSPTEKRARVEEAPGDAEKA
jgi:HAT1-interacting factor 1